MTVIIFLIFAGAIVAGGFLAGFIWAVSSGQFDDTTTPPVRMLLDESAPTGSEQRVRGTTHV
jgi:cbb3-type cytochrome oxidase maturation protein